MPKARVTKKGRTKTKDLKIYGGRYLVVGKNKEKAEAVAERVSNSEGKILILHPKRQVSEATARRTVLRDRKPLRITPKRPRIS